MGLRCGGQEVTEGNGFVEIVPVQYECGSSEIQKKGSLDVENISSFHTILELWQLGDVEG